MILSLFNKKAKSDSTPKISEEEKLNMSISDETVRDYDCETNLEKNQLDHKEAVQQSWTFYYNMARKFFKRFSKDDRDRLRELGRKLFEQNLSYQHAVPKPHKLIGKNAVKVKKMQVPSHERDSAKRAAG
ncbi:MAG: DUF2660 domain-containing protein [Pseudomonadota bacterium]